jgi:hypothetical protein
MGRGTSANSFVYNSLITMFKPGKELWCNIFHPFDPPGAFQSTHWRSQRSGRPCGARQGVTREDTEGFLPGGAAMSGK